MLRRRTLLSSLAILSLAGCATHGPGAPVAPGGTIHLSVLGQPGLNPGPDGVAKPVQLRIYSLRARDRFLNADYFQLAEKDKTVLGDDLLFRQDVTVRPGETQTVDSVVLPGQQLLGLSAGYRDIDHATWRMVAPLAAQQAFVLKADGIAASADARVK